MKNFIPLVWVVLCLPLGAATPLVLESDIPFAFEASGKVFPAGVYQIKIVNQAVGKINNVDPPKLTVLVAGNSWLARRGEGKPQLVFNKYGERHFLSQARGWETSLILLKSRHERELVTSRLVTRNANPQIVVAAARVVR